MLLKFKILTILLLLLLVNVYMFEKTWKNILIHEDLYTLYYGVS